MDDAKFFAIAQRLTQLSNQYTSQQLKHYHYVVEYDKTLESYGISKKDLVDEIKRRNSPDFKPEAPPAAPVPKPVPKKRF